MPTRCTAPDCTVEFDDSLAPEVLLAMFNLHARTAHPPQTNGNSVEGKADIKPEKIKRPVFTAAGTSEEFSYLIQRWGEYKTACGLQGNSAVFQLLECIDEPLRRDLTRLHGSMVNLTEESIIEKIKTLAVRNENVMVARVELLKMTQDREEPVRAYAARLKGQANICQFSIKCKDCNKDVSYSEQIVRDSLIRGIYDEDIYGLRFLVIPRSLLKL